MERYPIFGPTGKSLIQINFFVYFSPLGDTKTSFILDGKKKALSR